MKRLTTLTLILSVAVHTAAILGMEQSQKIKGGKHGKRERRNTSLPLPQQTKYIQELQEEERPRSNSISGRIEGNQSPTWSKEEFKEKAEKTIL